MTTGLSWQWCTACGSGKSALLRAFSARRLSAVRPASPSGPRRRADSRGFRAPSGRRREHDGRSVLVVDTAERLRCSTTGCVRPPPSLPGGGPRRARHPRRARRRLRARSARCCGRWRSGRCAGGRAEMLRRAGLDEASGVGQPLRARHPLSLQLAASALREDRTPPGRVLPTVVQELAALYTSTGSIPRRARRSTPLRPAPCHALPAGRALPDDLLRVSRASGAAVRELGREGMVVQDTVRGVGRGAAARRGSGAHRGYRAAAWRRSAASSKVRPARRAGRRSRT